MWILLFAIIPGTLLSQGNTPSSAAGKLEWQTEKLADGIYWKSYRGNDLFDSRQSINLIKVDLNSADVHYQIAYDQASFVKTSEFADQNGALAAINGSFFSVDSGGSVVFMKVDGEVIANGAVNRNFYTESGAIGWGDDGVPHILRKPDEGWHSVELPHILSSGPLLIHQNEKRNFNNDPFSQNRHPRTAVAITDNNQFIMATVDGRSFQSYGMTIPELAQFLQELGAVNALNLDGGGSTSMWVRNKNTAGVVNHPSDNFKFDHEGEREVSNALMLIAN